MNGDVRMKGFSKRASVAEALSLIEARVRPLPPERVPFARAGGRVLREAVQAPSDVPPHPRSAMDGYAVRAADVPGSLEVVGELKAAEQHRGPPLAPGEALRIMTGARIPPGADAVVMVEDTKADGARVHVQVAAPSGQHILETGADLRAGATVLAPGLRLGPRHVAMLAAVNALEVAVARRPRVRIVPTGNELVRAGSVPTGSALVESNSYLLEGLALRDGADPELYPIVSDDPEQLLIALSAPGADVVVVTGGSSVGKEDYAPVVLREHGELPIHGVAVKPASPTGIGFLGTTAVVLAPGYPVASYVAWDLFVRPILARLQGAEPRWPYAREPVRLAVALTKPVSRVELVRVTLAEDAAGGASPRWARPIPGGAALLSTLTGADAFLYLDAGRAEWAAGELVDASRFD
jgi:molybdopterin molybdotransferase